MTTDLKKLGFEVDVSQYTVGDILDLTDETIPVRDRILILQKGITAGDLRALRIVDLPKFTDAISAALTVQANPT